MDISKYSKSQIGSAKLIVKYFDYVDDKLIYSIGEVEKTDAEALYIIKFLSDRYKYDTEEAKITEVLNDWKTSKIK
tara:strand:+ start:497 stop:724 length:228 start_codon:yes stop_codon:yes gene_type:complete